MQACPNGLSGTTLAMATAWVSVAGMSVCAGVAWAGGEKTQTAAVSKSTPGKLSGVVIDQVWIHDTTKFGFMVDLSPALPSLSPATPSYPVKAPR